MPGRGLVGGPNWVTTDRFDIDAKTEGSVTHEQGLEMLRNLLAERFKLAGHRRGASRVRAPSVPACKRRVRPANAREHV